MSIYMNKYIWSYWNKFQKSISNFVAGIYFHRIVLSAIVINTLSMDIEYHEQPQSLTNALEYFNLVFTAIIIISLIELQENKNSGLSVLRTFRLLRVLKLVRLMSTLRRQL
ncbi:unnamed protein product, partial [Rotaria sp. Silwood1]